VSWLKERGGGGSRSGKKRIFEVETPGKKKKEGSGKVKDGEGGGSKTSN